METKTALRGDTMEKLQVLVRINIDSEKGLKEASHACEINLRSIDRLWMPSHFLDLGLLSRRRLQITWVRGRT